MADFFVNKAAEPKEKPKLHPCFIKKKQPSANGAGG
jgi:hypothetical protein